MQNAVLPRDYSVIFKSFLRYLPSRLLVVLNALVIVPIFAYFLSTSEMSIFQISIGILNLVCTASTDWIAKSVLRFYEQYKRFNRTDRFFSNIFLFELISFVTVFVSFFVFKNLICSKFYISQEVLLMTLILVIPCGIRQMLYQLLRIMRKTVLYTFSIVIYQITLLVLFLALSRISNSVMTLLFAMTFAVCFIDLLILYKLKLKEKISLKFSKRLSAMIVVYAIPLVFTNICIWSILHFGKFVFQFNKDFVGTAIVGTAWFFVSNVLTPLFSLLIFAIFPTIIRRFEKKYSVKNFMVSVLNSYIVMFFPFVAIFLLYFKDIEMLAFRDEYANLGLLLPFCAFTIFLHEFMKLMNMKYHMKNKTYIETLISFVCAFIGICLYLVLIKHFGILGFGVSMVVSMSLLLLANSLVKFKYLNYLMPKKLFKCFLCSVLIAGISYFIVFAMFFAFKNNFVIIIKIVLFLIIYAIVAYKFRKRIFS